MPEHWDVRRAKYIFKVIDDKTAKGDEELLSVSEHHGVIPRRHANVNTFKAESYEGYKLCKKGDLVINSLWAWSRGLGVSEHEGIISNAYSVYRLKIPASSRYLHYLLRTEAYVAEYLKRSKGIWISRLQLSDQQFLDLQIPLPPLPEQTAIANYLDAKTEQINRFIEKKEKLIALLKEQKAVILNEFVTEGLNSSALKKQTNLTWLGEIPSHWTLCKLKHIAKVQSGLALNEGVKIIDGVTLPYLRVANVQDGYIDLTEVKLVQVSPQTAERVRLKRHDLLMNEGGDFDKLGRGVVWEGQVEHCLHQNHVFAVRVNKDIDPYWINILTQTFYGRSYFISKAKRTTNLASISSSNIKEFPVLLPPKEEIDGIKNRLENEFSKIDNTIARIETEIEKVKELKQSLFAEVVTGRIKVA